MLTQLLLIGMAVFSNVASVGAPKPLGDEVVSEATFVYIHIGVCNCLYVNINVYLVYFLRHMSLPLSYSIQRLIHTLTRKKLLMFQLAYMRKNH
ncbi:hypothetical protein M514_13998, partial [Trichuris suis]